MTDVGKYSQQLLRDKTSKHITTIEQGPGFKSSVSPMLDLASGKCWRLIYVCYTLNNTDMGK